MPGYPRRDIESASVPPLDAAILFRDQWARADQAHLSAEDVDQLRQLVELPRTHPAADTRHAGVLGDLEEPLGPFIQMHQLVLELLCLVDHAPELEHLELVAVSTDAPLSENRRSAGIETDRD